MVHVLSNGAHEISMDHVPASDQHRSLVQTRVKLPMPAGSFSSSMSTRIFAASLMVPASAIARTHRSSRGRL
jgi:hypothetical protein